MRNANREIDSFVTEQITEARAILDRVLKYLSIDLSSSTAAKKAKERSRKSSMSVDFSMPLRAFVKKYGAGMAGPKKFVLVLAYLAKGNPDGEVALTEIENQWNRMTSKTLLGMKFNRFYTAQAKENDWVDTSKQGSYHLRPNWKSIFS